MHTSVYLDVDSLGSPHAIPNPKKYFRWRKFARGFSQNQSFHSPPKLGTTFFFYFALRVLHTDSDYSHAYHFKYYSVVSLVLIIIQTQTTSLQPILMLDNSSRYIDAIELKLHIQDWSHFQLPMHITIIATMLCLVKSIPE